VTGGVGPLHSHLKLVRWRSGWCPWASATSFTLLKKSTAATKFLAVNERERKVLLSSSRHAGSACIYRCSDGPSRMGVSLRARG